VLLVTDPSIDHTIANRIEPSDRIIDAKFERYRKHET